MLNLQAILPAGYWRRSDSMAPELLGLAGLLALVFASRLMGHQSMFGWLIIGAFALTATDADPHSLASVGPVNLLPEDVISALLICGAFWRPRELAANTRRFVTPALLL